MVDDFPPMSGTSNTGTYLGDDRHIELPLPNLDGDWSFVGWFLWLDGHGQGPLIASNTDRDWALIYDVGGRVAYRIAGQERLTGIESRTLKDRWTMVAVVRSITDLTLRIDDADVDVWPDAPGEGMSAAVVMKDAVGFVADVAGYEHRLGQDRLTVYWNLGRHRPV